MSDLSAFLTPDPHAALRARLASAFGPGATVDSLLACCRDEVTLAVHGHVSHYMFSGVYRGHEAIRALRRRMEGEIAVSDRRIMNLVLAEDRFALRRSVSARHHGTAVTRRLVVANFGRLEDGRIAELHEYVDTEWLSQLSAGP